MGFKIYNYKIQWILPVRERKSLLEALKVIKILGHRSFDSINFLNNDMKVIEQFPNIMYSSDQELKVIRDIKKIMNDNSNINIEYIELFRK
jgi:actin-related protein